MKNLVFIHKWPWNLKKNILIKIKRFQEKNLALRMYSENEILFSHPHSNIFQDIKKYGKVEVVSIYQEPGLEREQESLTKDWQHLYGEYPVLQPYIYTTNDVISYKNSFLAKKVDDSYLIWEQMGGRSTTIPAYLTDLSVFNRLPGFREPKPIKVDFGLFLNTRNPKNYFHWLFDGLSRLEALDKLSISTEDIKYVTTFSLSKWHFSTLSALGIEPSQCIELRGCRAHFNKLLVLSPRRNHFRFSPDNCKWLREKTKEAYQKSNFSKNEASFSKRFIVGRRRTNGRCILNQQEVLDQLKPYGFQLYYLEELDFLEQYSLFANADVVIAPHGAGLANLVFCENARVIEIFSDRILPFYFLLSKTLGLNYTCIQGKVDRDNSSKKRPDFLVDVNQLTRAIFGSTPESAL